MSTTPNIPHPPSTDRPDPQQLTGAEAAVWAVLSSQPGATSADLAQAAGAGRSTTTKALRVLEQMGLARCETSAAEGRGRPVNYWYATPSPDNDPGFSTNTPQEPSPETITGPEPATPHTGDSAHAAEPPTCGDDRSRHGETHVNEPDSDAEHTEHEDQSDAPRESERETESDGSPTPAPAPTPRVAGTMPPGAPEPVRPTALSGTDKVRLAPGALRQMVIDHLTAHPNEAFTATRISRTIAKSSGAIANALATLTKQGIAEQVTEHPRTYRLATTPANGDA
ncbi:MarR family transcriptional regulator [Streptomyces coffeae]|uniref:MarR family transcriptional regulator n=1 Tax=Streptomyces coffeae TaxID=621382 RepID=A0ABS1NS11_9ACTN|nr:helix-turn-helix domain-containing protein [Streptomyces coffeae]MBL1102804.1 MarR family transcriptional regulator [Streptomyces coffeae]